jgi:hypothetical protein
MIGSAWTNKQQPTTNEVIMSLTDFYSGVDSAPELKQKNWIQPGVYVVKVAAFRAATREHDGKKFQVIEMDIVETLKKRGEESHAPGERVTHMMNMAHKKTDSRIKQFLGAVSGVEQTAITSAKCIEIAQNNELIAGLELIAQAYEVTTNSGNPFTVVDYQALSDRQSIVEESNSDIPF